MSSAGAAGTARLTIVSENYWPEVAATAQLLTELAEGLSSDFDVEVLTTQPRYHGVYTRRPARETRNGVAIRRLWATRFPKSSRLGRLVNWITLLLSISLAVTGSWHRRTYLFLTNPPTTPWAAVLARVMRQRAFILVHDLYPDLAEVVGAVPRGSVVARAFDAVNKFSFRRAEAVIVLGRDMERRLKDKLGRDARIQIIPNWANSDIISPRMKASSGFARRHGLADRFVFLYAGNLGLFQDLETLVRALHSLDGVAENACLVFVGDGAKRKALELTAAESDRVLVFDYVPREELGDLYAAADVGLISLEPGAEQTNVPSKTYSIMAAGLPFLAVAEGSSDLKALADGGCGVVVANDPTSVAAAFSRFLTDKGHGRALGAQAHQLFQENYTRQAIVERYRQLLREEE